MGTTVIHVSTLPGSWADKVLIMRWTRRGSTASRSVQVDPTVFDTAARDLGFTLDEAQRRVAVGFATADRNLYLWGPVGRGKSWLMAVYFAAVPTDRKIRIHFHEFFRNLHSAIRRSGNNLSAALDELLGGLDVVCFDEFHVHDPADGKFIARLLPTLLDRQIRVIVTSNYPPEGLLPNPLFHADFAPTIELIERSMTVVAIDGRVDYRTISAHETGFAAGWWVSPGTPEQLGRLVLHSPTVSDRRMLSPAGHPILARSVSDGCLWIDFLDLCEGTTAPMDYLALTRDFREWVITGVPDLRAAGSEPAQRFANVVDVLYDRHITTVFLATCSLQELVNGDRLPIDIARVMSRLGQLRRIELEAAEP
ncbi:cell division protein ZapE [Aldersonia sp. NBC_00410]|uniref:cell division protein ZapE n=1 Tax=Aldersonia sp. NBC_00410 TaxID=2975954 RepID=UPI00225565BA|nr:cell division protein ZapE [Aldersonia sp. NBC_00410]MCX5045755.1 cell division protein ZapE [Aldersonia sp. NBC_00410]